MTQNSAERAHLGHLH